MADVNPIQVQKYLQGVNYPVSKGDIIKRAQQEGADQNVVQTLQQLPDKQYNSPVDVSEAIGKIE